MIHMAIPIYREIVYEHIELMKSILLILKKVDEWLGCNAIIQKKGHGAIMQFLNTFQLN